MSKSRTRVEACYQCKQPGDWLEFDGYDECPMCGATVKQHTAIEAQKDWEEIQESLRKLEQTLGFKMIEESTQKELRSLQELTDQRLHLFRTINNDEVDEIWNSK